MSGEVYEADEQLLTYLDKWEKVPELYDRKLIQVTFDSGKYCFWQVAGAAK